MRRGLRLVPVLVCLAASFALAGCFEDRSPVDVTPYLRETSVAPGSEAVVPLFLNSTQTFKQGLGIRVGELPQGWTYRLSTEEVALPGFKGRLVVARFVVPADAETGVRGVDVYAGDTRATIQLNVARAGANVTSNATVRVTLVHLDVNGTILAASATNALSDHLKGNAPAGAQPLPSLLYLGDDAAPNDTRPVAGPLRERLLASHAGEIFLLETRETADPLRVEGPTDGACLLVRVDAVESPPPAV